MVVSSRDIDRIRKVWRRTLRLRDVCNRVEDGEGQVTTEQIQVEVTVGMEMELKWN